MNILDMRRMPVLLVVVGLLSTLAASQVYTRWLHVCMDTPETITCPERHIFNITDAVLAYKADYCPSNVTDPVETVADCYERFPGKQSLIASTSSRCNGSRSCDIYFGGAVLLTCSTADTGTANFLAVSYKCYSDPNRQTTTQSTTTATTTVTPSSQPTTSASTKEPLPYVIPVAIVAVAVLIGLILVVSIIVYRKRRNMVGTTGEGHGAESATYYNMQVGYSPSPPDLNARHLNTNNPIRSTEIEEDKLQPPHYENASQIDQSTGTPLSEHNYEKIGVSNDPSAYTRMAFSPDYVNAGGF